MRRSRTVTGKGQGQRPFQFARGQRQGVDEKAATLEIVHPSDEE